MNTRTKIIRHLPHRRIAISLAMLAIAAVLAFGSTARAGQFGSYASCQVYADGSGSCSGSFYGFRNASSGWAFASFSMYSWYDGVFMADDGYRSGRCMVSRDSPLYPFFLQGVGQRSYFSVYWDSNATCTHIQVLNSSMY